jgi:hypothetical protein
LKSGSSATVTWGDKGFNKRSEYWQNEYVGQLQLVKGGDLGQNPAPIPPVNFSVITGSVAITVPNVQGGDDYQLLLTFVSLNQAVRPNVAALSGDFTIENDSNTTSTFVAGTSTAVTGVISATGSSVTVSGTHSVVVNGSDTATVTSGTASTTIGNSTASATTTVASSTATGATNNDAKNKSGGAMSSATRSVGLTVVAALVGSMLFL